MNDIALSRGIKIDITSAARPAGQPVKGAKVDPAKDSFHHVGRAVDVNLVDKDGNRYKFDDLMPGNLSENIQGFVADVKALRFSTSVDTDRAPRWGRI